MTSVNLRGDCSETSGVWERPQKDGMGTEGVTDREENPRCITL